MHRCPLVRTLVALLILLGAVQGAAAATMPFFCCGGISLDGVATMQAGDDCGVTCSACAVCHSIGVVPPTVAQDPNGVSVRFVEAGADLLSLAFKPLQRPPRA